MERKKYYAMDIAKFIAALLVICIHTGPLLDINLDANFVIVQIIARIAVPLFFIISGFLFFEKIDLRREWNDAENIQVLKHYVWRLFKIYFVWTILYLPFTYWILHSGDGITLATILRYIRDFFFTGSFYHLWFLPALLFAVFITYFMVMKLHVKKTLWIAFLLYVIGMLGNVYPKVLADIPVVAQLYKGYIAVFVTTRNGLFFGMIFIALGAYFAKHKVYLKRSAILMGLCISLALLFGECYLLRYAGFMNDLTCMYFMLLPCVSFLFLWLMKIELTKRKVYKIMRQMSLLIYVSHIMFVSILAWTCPQLNSLLIYLLSVGASILLSYVILLASKRIKFLQVLY